MKDRAAWKGYHLPEYDIPAMCERTKETPVWMHFGSGNIFRAFLCSVVQELLEKGIMTSGITAAESHGTEIITECFKPHDNLAVAVTLCGDGSTQKEVVGSVGEALSTEFDFKRVEEIFCNSDLQMVSFTITEKGYAIRNAAGELIASVVDDMTAGPDAILAQMEMGGNGRAYLKDHSERTTAPHLMAMIASLAIRRFRTVGTPIALVSMDNCSHNGEKIENAVKELAEAWLAMDKITQAEFDYLRKKVSYPWSMIDKITPRPDAKVEESLVADGIEDVRPFVTPNGTYIAPFVNAERPQYLVIEDDFPNGRPALENGRGIIFTDRETVNKAERMKVCTCLNPLHTALAIYGCLLGYTSISAEMKDTELVTLITRMSAEEGMPVVVDPGIIDPKQFLNECLTERFPNPFMPDTPQRIATDTSQKLPIRYGENFKAHIARGDVNKLVYMPLVIAGWLRYLTGIDDEGNAFTPSSDPLLEDAQQMLIRAAFYGSSGLGDDDGSESLADSAASAAAVFCKTISASALTKLLSNTVIFGADLAAAGLSDLIAKYFNEMNAEPGAVRKTLKKYTA